MSVCVYTVKEIAALLRVSSKTVYNMIHAGDLEYIQVRGQIRITSCTVNRLLKGGLNNEER